MLSLQHTYMQKNEDDLVHIFGYRKAPKRTSAKTKRDAWVYGSAALGSAVAATAGAHYLSKPGVRKKIGKMYRKVRAKVSSRVRILRRGSSVKVFKRKTTDNRKKLMNKSRVLGIRLGNNPRHVNKISNRTGKTMFRNSRAANGLGSGKKTARISGAITRRRNTYRIAKRSPYKRSR